MGFRTFKEFFKKATGFDPYPYQERWAMSAQFPSLVSVPTGLGKTAGSILGWLWKRRFADEEIRRSTPRRLVYCLPMRVLVEQTRDCSKKWLKNLGLFAEEAPDKHPEDKIAVHTLIGGDLEIDWDLWPERDQILIGTQDMLLSRALNRGYAMSRFRWPMQFGLLNNDCLWVMDEVQLMGNGLATTAQLEAFRHKLGTVIPSGSIWMSATMQPKWLETVDFHAVKALEELGITDADKVHPMVEPRFEAVKPLERAVIEASVDGKVEADLLLQHHRLGTRTLCVVNTVKRSQAIYEALRLKKPNANLVLLHSRFRQPDRDSALQRILAEPSEHGTIAVSTQVVEAGVDVSARLLVTDLAPWASLVQRFGRCNRKGEIQDAHVIWISPPDLNDDQKLKAAPYSPEELRDAAHRLVELTDVGIRSLPPFQEELNFTHVIRRKDIVDLFDTTPDLAGADIDVSRFIREADENHLQVFWRAVPEKDEPLPTENAPSRHELCSVPIGDFRIWLKKKHDAWRWDHLSKKWTRTKPDAIYPGMVLMLRTFDGGYSEQIGWTGKEKTTEPIVVSGRTSEATDDDHYSEKREWTTIAEHTDRVAAAVTGLVDELLPHTESWREAIIDTARWHDAGKAHSVFQAAMPKGAPHDDELWAKTKMLMKRYERPGFRHELASAIAILQNGLPDLNAYLAASHHGKVRLSIRSLPNEKYPSDDPEVRFARGIWQGDVLPSVDLGSGVLMPSTALDLSYMELGEDETTGPSWLARMLALRDDPKIGLFRLAFLEALLRVADWRASGEPVDEANDGVKK